MRSLQFVEKAILILLTVLILDAPSIVSALGVKSSFLSGETTLKTLSLEDDFAVLASSPDSETVTSHSGNSPVSHSVTSSISAALSQSASSDNIAIRAVNPGYNTDTGKNSGELIELINLAYHQDHSTIINLDNIAIVYVAKPTASNPYGKSTVLYEFPEGARFTGTSILFRFVDAPEVAENAQDLTYDTSLAMSGSLYVVKFSDVSAKSSILSDFSFAPALAGTFEVLSSVCWLGGDDCLPIFTTTVKSRSYTTILRDDESGIYAHTNDYTPLFDSENPALYLPPATTDSGSDVLSSGSSDSGPDSTSDSRTSFKSGASTSSKPSATSSKTTTTSVFDMTAAPVCSSLEFSEILSYYTDDAVEQFIEFYNTSAMPIQPQGCMLRYKSKYYDLVNATITTDGTATASTTPATIPGYGYYLFHPSDNSLKLTKNPTTENLFELFDINGNLVDSVNLPHGQKSGTSYAQIGLNSDSSENWQVTYAPTPGEPNIYQEFRTCPAGKIINEATGNCVNAATLSSTLKDCGEGKYRNPETGRCKSYDSDDSEQAPCKDGYERNPETGRCRKIKENSGADYPLIPITDTEEQTTFIALWAIIGIAGLGAIYVIFQFRREIIYFIKKHFTKFKKP